MSGLISGFIEGAAGRGAEMLQDDRRSDIAVKASKSVAEYQSDLAMKKERMVEEMRVGSANRQREEQVSRIDAAAGGIAEEAVAGKRGLINSNITDKESWTPEQQAAVDQSLDIDKNKVATDPHTRTRAAIATGDISPKDAATMDSRGEIAQMKNDAYLANVQAKLDMAGDKLAMAQTIATIRAAGGGSGDGKDPANAKMIEYLVKNGTPREQATGMVLGDGAGKTKDPVGLAAQLATALIRDGIRVPADAPKGTTPASYAMEIATQQIEAATKKFNKGDGASPGAATAPKPAAPAAAAQPKPPAGLPQGARQIGTSGGKPVFETPDGKRFVQK